MDRGGCIHIHESRHPLLRRSDHVAFAEIRSHPFQEIVRLFRPECAEVGDPLIDKPEDEPHGHHYFALIFFFPSCFTRCRLSTPCRRSVAAASPASDLFSAGFPSTLFSAAMLSSLLRPKQTRQRVDDNSQYSGPSAERRHAAADFTEDDGEDEITEEDEDDQEADAGEEEEGLIDEEDGEDETPLLPIFSAAHLGPSLPSCLPYLLTSKRRTSCL